MSGNIDTTVQYKYMIIKRNSFGRSGEGRINKLGLLELKCRLPIWEESLIRIGVSRMREGKDAKEW